MEVPQTALKVQFGPVLDKTIEMMRTLNLALLPVHYNQYFYQKALGYTKYSQFVYFNDIVVGGLICREEMKNDEKTLYILTFGVLEAYRKQGIGVQLFEQLLNMAKKDPELKKIYLHVQISNERAIRFYQKVGFEIVEKIENYYQDIDPPHCFYLSRAI